MAAISVTAFHRGKTLAQDELLEPSPECPICANRGNRHPVVRLQEDPTIDFLRCTVCNGISASRMPRETALSDYYENYYDRVAQELITFHRPQRLANLIASNFKIPKTVPLAGLVRILDFGGGDGAIAALCAEQLIQQKLAESVAITVVDVVSDSARRLPETITMSFAPSLDAVDGLFDIVIASAILEHIPAFSKAFDTLMRSLQPGGLFYARTPFMTPLGKLLPLDLTYPAHVHDIGANCWNWLQSNAGIDVTVLSAGPSIVESGIQTHAVRTIAAHILKFPARVLAFSQAKPYWPFYGGWQVLWRRASDDRYGNA